jgi:glycosyltransferase involved in cell wall biosynthesis
VTADNPASDVNLKDGLVSIIVPSYNQGKFIRRTLESIFSQDYRPIEVIVIDGASTDETPSVLESFDSRPELSWVSEPDSGVVEAVNKGFARAKGEFGAIQSSDDFYLPGAVSAGVSALRKNPSLAFAFGDVAKVDEQGRSLSRTELPPFTLEGMLTFAPWIPQPSTFFRMGLAKALGGWRTHVPYAADTDLWLRMALQAPAAKIEALLAERSMHADQRDKQGARIARDYAKAIETLPGLEAASPRVRRAARAGTLLMKNRYDPGASEIKRVARLWGAVLAYPALRSRLSLAQLIPGYYRFRAVATSAFRRAGLPRKGKSAPSTADRS